MTLTALLITELRRYPYRFDTGQLARRCAAGRPHAVRQVGAELRRLLAGRVVRRIRPGAPNGGGRPPWRWELARHSTPSP